MAAFEVFLASGATAALVLGVVLLEALLLTLRWRRRAGPGPRHWLSQIAAGTFLVAALLAAQLALHPMILGACLIGAGIAHLAGYRQRWRLKVST